MKTILAAIILVMLQGTATSQWSNDPSENTRVTNGGLLPQIITDGSGGAYIVYQDSPALLRQLWVQWLDRFGLVRFPENGMRISSAERNQTPYYYLVSDSAGGVIVLFDELHLVGDPVNGETYNAIYAQRIDSTGTKLWGEAGVELSTFVEGASKAAISACSDGENGAFVFWGEDADQNGAFELRAQRITANGQFAWPDTGIVVTNKFIFDNLSSPNPAVSDGAGSAIILYSDSSQTNFDTKLQKLSAAGAFLWDEGVDIFPVGRQMVGDDFGGAVVAGVRREFDGVSFKYIVGAQRVDSGGQALWGEKGVIITNLGDTFTNAVYVVANDNKTAIAWQDGRTGQSNVYLQLTDQFGVPQWQEDGIMVSSVESIKFRPSVVKGFNLNTIVVWRDNRIKDGGIFVQEFDSTGLALLNEDTAISVRNHFQQEHEVTSDNAGGAIVCWYEIGTGSGWGIFAQQVSRNGNLGEVLITSVSEPNISSIPSQYILRQSYPNPFNAEMVIKYEIPESNQVEITIYDITGKEVITLVNKNQPPGIYQIDWNGKDAKGGDVASGLYFYQLRAGSFVVSKKAIFIK